MNHTRVQTLDKKQTLALLRSRKQWDAIEARGEDFRIKSQYLCDFLNDLEKEGYVYNLPAQRRFEEEHGIGPFSEGHALGTLIYNAQRYRREDAIRAEGFSEGTPEMLREAFAKGKVILLRGEGAFGDDVTAKLRVRQVGDKLLAFLPRKRRTYVPIEDQWCKIAA